MTTKWIPVGERTTARMVPGGMLIRYGKNMTLIPTTERGAVEWIEANRTDLLKTAKKP